MTNATHTQGPWSIRRNFNGRGALDLFGEGGQIIIGNALIINQEANARLIAAAPDLLQALHDVDAYLAPEGDEEDHYNYIRAIIKGAISKAQGA
jgi:hypothetical protein